MTLNHPRTYQFIFLLCVSVLFVNIYELTFAIWFLAALLTVAASYSVSILKFVSCFAAILVIAGISALFHHESPYNFFRDISYLMKPILGLLAGYQLYKKVPGKFFSTVIYSGAAIATGHLIVVFITFLRFHTITVVILREYCGYFSDFEIYALLILIFYKRFNLPYTKKRVYFLIAILSLSSFLYLSRTNMIQLIILYCAMKGFFEINRRSIMLTAIAVGSVVIGYFAILSYNPHRGGKGLEAFLYKIKIAPEEAFKTKVDVNDWKDFNDNYRSVENILAVQRVSSDGFWSILFGKGLGSRINLGQKIFTNDGEFIQVIPILHNGFATVFLKSGLVGVCILITFIYMVGKSRRNRDPDIQNMNLLFLGTALFLIVSNWVFMGLYLKLDNKSILIGFMLAYREHLLRQKAAINTIDATA